MSRLPKAIYILLSMILIFSSLAATQPPMLETAQAATCKQWHTVQRGEYLVNIAKMYGTDWRTLVEINGLKNANLIYAGQKLCVSVTNPGTTPVIEPENNQNIRVYALSVKEDVSVTLQGRNLKASSRYSIYLSKYGNYPAGAQYVGSVVTDTTGRFKVTYNIPKKLVDVIKISININNNQGDSASNWFINATATGNTGGIQAPDIKLTILEVDRNRSIKIRVGNLPANVVFNVLMGKEGSKGVNGTKVGTLVNDDEGTVRGTFEIPTNLEGKARIDLRIENKKLGISYYVTFDNKDTR